MLNYGLIFPVIFQQTQQVMGPPYLLINPVIFNDWNKSIDFATRLVRVASVYVSYFN